MTNHSTQMHVSDEQSMLARYRRAEAMEHAMCTESIVLNPWIFPHWIGNSNCFWYSRKNRQGDDVTSQVSKEFRLVNAETTTNTAAFDHKILAQTLSRVAKQNVNPDDAGG